MYVGKEFEKILHDITQISKSAELLNGILYTSLSTYLKQIFDVLTFFISIGTKNKNSLLS